MIVKSAKLGKVGGKVLLAAGGKPREGEGRGEICASTDLKVAKCCCTHFSVLQLQGFFHLPWVISFWGHLISQNLSLIS